MLVRAHKVRMRSQQRHVTLADPSFAVNKKQLRTYNGREQYRPGWPGNQMHTEANEGATKWDMILQTRLGGIAQRT
jgi:hypothetical protein